MPTIVLKVDLECSRCYEKIQRVLTRLQEKGEPIETIVYKEKENKVIISGPFDAEELCRKLCCKAWRIIKEYEILPPPPPPPPPEPKPEPPKEKPPPPPPPEPKPEPPKEKPPPPKPKPEPPKPEPPPPPKPVAPKPPQPPKCPEWLLPYPIMPYPYPAFCCWQPCPCYDYRGHGGCRCCSCGKAYDNADQQPPPPVVAPRPSWCDGASSVGMGYKIVCEDDPAYACSIM